MNQSTCWSSGPQPWVRPYRTSGFDSAVLLHGWGRAGVWELGVKGRRGEVWQSLDYWDKLRKIYFSRVYSYKF